MYFVFVQLSNRTVTSSNDVVQIDPGPAEETGRVKNVLQTIAEKCDKCE